MNTVYYTGFTTIRLPINIKTQLSKLIGYIGAASRHLYILFGDIFKSSSGYTNGFEIV